MYPRLGDRRTVDQSGQLIMKRQGRFGRVKEITIPVHILDVSISGASLRAGRDEEIMPKQLALLDVDGDTGNVRVIWVRPEDDHNVALGVQFLDPRPRSCPRSTGGSDARPPSARSTGTEALNGFRRNLVVDRLIRWPSAKSSPNTSQRR